MMQRKCADCQLCCRLLPMQKNSEDRHPEAIAAAIMTGLAVPGIPDFDKPAGERCQHQRHHKGCAVYGRHPFGCQIWNCRWLVDPETSALRRPDRAGYVIDMMPDFVTLSPNDGGEPMKIEVVQIWLDGKRPNAWREDAALRDYLIRRGAEGKAALMRFNERDAFTLWPPSLCDDGQWHETPRRGQNEPQHIGKDLIAGLAACRKVKVTQT